MCFIYFTLYLWELPMTATHLKRTNISAAHFILTSIMRNRFSETFKFTMTKTIFRLVNRFILCFFPLFFRCNDSCVYNYIYLMDGTIFLEKFFICTKWNGINLDKFYWSDSKLSNGKKWIKCINNFLLFLFRWEKKKQTNIGNIVRV